MRTFGLFAVLGAILLAVGSAFTATRPAPEAAHWRHPVALAVLPDGKHLLTANRAAGSLSLVHVGERTLEEIDLGKSLVDVVAGSDGNILAVDEAENRLYRLRWAEGRLRLVDRLEVPIGPISVRLATDGKTAFVASRWARCVSAIDLGPTLKVRWTRGLGFPPRPLTITPDGDHLIVGDAFAGRLALLETTNGKVVRAGELPGHNLGGFTWSPEGKLLVAYSVMDQTTDATMYNVHWGNVVIHRLRQLDLKSLLDPQAEILSQSKQFVLDGLTNGATDPGSGAFDASGRMLLCIGGLDGVMIDARTDGQRQRLRAGKRPAALAVVGKMAYIANTFDDTVSVLDLENDRLLAPIALGNTPALTDAMRGQRLFHDARQSHNGWMSCHTCHSEGHTNGKRSDTLADGHHGSPKRTLSLLGVAETGPWNWNGQTEKLEDLVDRSLRTTMFPDDVVRDDVRALSAYLRTLPAPPPEPVTDAEAVKRGQALFAEQNCARCHAPPLYTSKKQADVGLIDEKGGKEFNPPSLRGVRLAGPYFHDNRAKSLADVFRVHKHQLKGELSAEQVRDLVAFLESL